MQPKGNDDDDEDEPIIGPHIDKKGTSVFVSCCGLRVRPFTFSTDFLHALFQIKNWPVEQEADQARFEEIILTHNVNPLPAYDVNRDLINPKDYRAELEGAIVELKFMLTRWSTRNNNEELNRDIFCADIYSIHVIIPSPSQASSSKVRSPKKRKLPRKIDAMESPTKKKHVD